MQPGGFLGRLLGPLMKVGFPLIKNVLMPLAKSVLTTLGLTAATSVTDKNIHKKIFIKGSGTSGTSGSGETTLIISNEEMKVS